MAWETESLHYTEVRSRLLHCADLIREVSPERVLELGCGTGVLRSLLHKCCPAAVYYGCDVSRSALRVITDARPDELAHCDLNTDVLPFNHSAFDVVVCSGVLEYLTCRDTVLARVRQRLRTGGYFVTSFVNVLHADRVIRAWRGARPRRHPEWTSIVMPDEIERVIVRAGFIMERRVPSRYGLCLKSPERRWERRKAARQMRAWLPMSRMLGAQFVYRFRAR